MRDSKLGRLATVLVPSMAGLVASTLLLVDYLRPAPVFCDEGGGCAAMKKTAWAFVMGIPTPAFGIAAFVLLGTLALLRGPMARGLLLGFSVVGAAGALFLIGVQIKLGAFCKFCLVADVSLILIAAAAYYRYRSRWELERVMSLEAYAGAMGIALAFGLPFLFGMRARAEVGEAAPVPQVIEEELQKTPPGKITVVDFVDFECPFCKMTHEEIAPVLAKHADKVRVVRKHVPLSHIHPHAEDAARAACCAETMGKGDEMAEALFASASLTREDCEKIAASLGLSSEAFKACLDDPRTKERLDADRATFKAAGGRALPTLFIHRSKIEGARDRAELERTVEEAVRATGS